MPKFIPINTPLREFKGHEERVSAVAVFPDRRRMITGSWDKTLRLWDLKTGVVLKKMEGHQRWVCALTVSRDGQIIASGGDDGELIVWNGETGKPLAQPIKAHFVCFNSLDFSVDGTVLATGGDDTVKLWCTKTWQQQGNEIRFNREVRQVQYSPSGELLAIATNLIPQAEADIEIYNAGTRERVATLKDYNSLVWTPDGTRLLSGSGSNHTIHEWDTSTWEKVGDPWKGHTNSINAIAINPAGTLVLVSASDDNHDVRLWRLSDRQNIAILEPSFRTKCVTFSVDGKHILSGASGNSILEWDVSDDAISEILALTAAHHACVTGDLSTAEQLMTQEVDTNPKYTSYANRSFVMARQHDWDHALEDAIKSISIQPSSTGYISKGIALCGKGHIRDARVAFDVASMFNQDSEEIRFLLLTKAIALFNADQHEEAMLLIKELAAVCSNSDLLACRVVEAYLRVELENKALDGAHYDEAAEHFAAAVNSSAFPSKTIHELCEDLIVFFGWDLETFWLTAHQKHCQAFLSAGKVEEALESHQHMMDVIDETEKANCLDWSNHFKGQCSALAARDDRILATEIPGQEQYGYDAEPDFFQGMHDHPQTSRQRPQLRLGHFKKLTLAMTKSPHPAPPPAPPTSPPTVAAPSTIKAQLRNLFTWQSDHAAASVVDVPFAKGKERNAAADAPAKDEDLVPDEYFDDLPQNSNTQQPNSQQQPVVVQVDTGEHGGGKSCFCC